MNTTQFVLVATLAAALPAHALGVKAVTAKPTADNPQFANKQAWPDLVGDEYFLKATWPKARLLIWPHAGRSFGRGEPKPDPLDPASWSTQPRASPPTRRQT